MSAVWCFSSDTKWTKPQKKQYIQVSDQKLTAD